MHTDRAETIGLSALVFLASDAQRLANFLSTTGIGPAELKAEARAPHMLVGVLEYLLQDESMLLVFCAAEGIRPEDVAPARRSLAKLAGETGEPEFSV